MSRKAKKPRASRTIFHLTDMQRFAVAVGAIRALDQEVIEVAKRCETNGYPPGIDEAYAEVIAARTAFLVAAVEAGLAQAYRRRVPLKQRECPRCGTCWADPEGAVEDEPCCRCGSPVGPQFMNVLTVCIGGNRFALSMSAASHRMKAVARSGDPPEHETDASLAGRFSFRIQPVPVTLCLEMCTAWLRSHVRAASPVSTS